MWEWGILGLFFRTSEGWATRDSSSYSLKGGHRPQLIRHQVTHVRVLAQFHKVAADGCFQTLTEDRTLETPDSDMYMMLKELSLPHPQGHGNVASGGRDIFHIPDAVPLYYSRCWLAPEDPMNPLSLLMAYEEEKANTLTQRAWVFGQHG